MIDRCSICKSKSHGTQAHQAADMVSERSLPPAPAAEGERDDWSKWDVFVRENVKTGRLDVITSKLRALASSEQAAPTLDKVEQAKKEMRERLVVCDASLVPHSMAICSCTEGHKFPRKPESAPDFNERLNKIAVLLDGVPDAHLRAVKIVTALEQAAPSALAALQKLLPLVRHLHDTHVGGGGWQSDELVAAIEQAEQTSK